ncbi:hypothetical protein [Sphingobium sp.]|uniref:hypothetical protein n=1 Tax=Sphingobium sp. TaxID=1912891 RepID=UPI002BF02E94|nr:hypothetical protein [Sphingobium sp.]HUD89994.1 hypothetical protein [Sphingobium sp.]
MLMRFCIACCFLLLLIGCSYVYELQAIVLDGRLAFIVSPSSQRSADCIRSIDVSAETNVRATPTFGDDRQLVKNGSFWQQATAIEACLNPFPVIYGTSLKGEPFSYNGQQIRAVRAKPLQVGVIYQVQTSGSGSGGGVGRFRILPNRRVENLPLN